LVALVLVLCSITFVVISTPFLSTSLADVISLARFLILCQVSRESFLGISEKITIHKTWLVPGILG